MADSVLVELVCVQEDHVVAEVETTEVIDVEVLKRAKVKSPNKMPPNELILEGVQLTCARCHGLLYFKTAGGELTLAIPGMFRVEA